MRYNDNDNDKYLCEKSGNLHIIVSWDSSSMEHHGEICVWALVWCFWVFFYSILSLQWYLMDLWVNEDIDDDNIE